MYILILQSLLGKFDLGANKINDNQFSKPFSWERPNIEVGRILFMLVPLGQF